MTQPSAADPRPRVQAGPDGQRRVAGRRCTACAEVTAFDWPRCPACRGEVEPADFGPEGVVWSSTVVRIPVPGRVPPYSLAYVDLDDGPRVLAHVVDGSWPTTEAAPIGGRVRLVPPSLDGDLRVEVLENAVPA